MSYCGKCDSHDVTFKIYNDGVECSICGFDYNENIDKDILINNFKGIRQAKISGWKTYPQDGFFFDTPQPINDAYNDAKNKLISLGIDITKI